ncbi:hypothetical protein PIB30_100331 [Stylosanthes scabra]|uniref:Uncharacterized protein n=1 Tax=Stylosanthes scabra TaxID=79078 RepID=A0ABU6SXY5_9FABA|nr:hypothetical protein [Stylosanthes scabra]
MVSWGLEARWCRTSDAGGCRRHWHLLMWASAAGYRCVTAQSQCRRDWGRHWCFFGASWVGCGTGAILVHHGLGEALFRQKHYIKRAGHLHSSFHTLHTNSFTSLSLSFPNSCAMDLPQPLVIRLHPNAVAHERQDGVWFQSESPVVFQHADISTMTELQVVFLYHLGGGFTEIRKVGYRYLQRQPDGRFHHLLVWLFNDEHVRVTFGCHRRLMPQHVMDFLVEVGRIPAGMPVAATPVRIADPPPETEAAMGYSDSKEDNSDYATSTASSSDAQEGGAGSPETRSASRARHVLPAPPPIPGVEDVPCYFQQLSLDEGASSDPLNSGISNDYNTDGGAEIRAGHRMRNREAVQTAVKNYSIRRNAEYRVIESDRIKFH